MILILNFFDIIGSNWLIPFDCYICGSLQEFNYIALEMNFLKPYIWKTLNIWHYFIELPIFLLCFMWHTSITSQICPFMDCFHWGRRVMMKSIAQRIRTTAYFSLINFKMWSRSKHNYNIRQFLKFSNPDGICNVHVYVSS
jgi:hypothetical protein